MSEARIERRAEVAALAAPVQAGGVLVAAEAFRVATGIGRQCPWCPDGALERKLHRRLL